MEQLAVDVPKVQILEIPVPQLVDQLDVLKILGMQLPVLPVQVIEVPSSSTPSRCSGTVLSAWQMAEQLVEVPTLLSVAVLQQRTAEQLASIPVPRGRHGRLPGSLPGQAQQRLWLSRLPTFLLPVEVFMVFARDSFQQRFPSRTFPLQLHAVEVFVVVFAVFLRFRAPKGFFALFPGWSRRRRRRRRSSRSRPWWSSATPRAGPTSGTVGSGTGTGAPVPVATLFLLCLLSEAHRGEGLGIPSPGATSGCLVRCLRAA